MDRMRPSDAFAGGFCEAKGAAAGPLRGGGPSVLEASAADGWLYAGGTAAAGPPSRHSIARGGDARTTRGREGRGGAGVHEGRRLGNNDAPRPRSRLEYGKLIFGGNDTSATGPGRTDHRRLGKTP